MKALIILVLLFPAAHFSSAQTAVFNYETEMCEHTATYTKAKYTEEQLRNTFYYLCNAEYLTAPANTRNPDENLRQNEKRADDECTVRMHILANFAFVETKFWKQSKANRIRETEELCRLKAITAAAYYNPDTLKYYSKTNPAAEKYREALIAGGDKLLDAWKALNEEMKKNNGSPEVLQKEFERQYNSPEKMQYARIQVMTYGWWNNCNKLLYRSDETINYYREFEKLFISVKNLCEEHDE